MKALGKAIVCGLLSWLAVAPVHASSATLDQVRERGAVRCGVSTGLPGFSQQNAKGDWEGLDADLCRGVAAAVFGNAEKVEFVPLSTTERLTALSDGKVDLLARNTTWTLDRDVILRLDFVGTNYYDGQGFMARKGKGLRSALQLDGVSICVQRGSTSIDNVERYFTQNRMQYRLVTQDSPGASGKAFETGQCDVLTSDQSQLYALRSQFTDPADFVILPEVISREPLGPVVREGDDTWSDIVQWTLFTMINAEELGLSSDNVERVKERAQNPAIRHFLGLDGATGKALGLDDLWAYQIIKQVGNYGQSFDRNVGKHSPLHIGRGLNALWRDGGLMYAPPAR